MVALTKHYVKPIKIYEKQAMFRQSEAWLRGFVGGRGTGKTFIGALDVANNAKRGEPWLCVAPDNNMAREVVLPVLEDVLTRTGQYIKHVVSPAPKVFFKTKDGGKAEIIIRGAEKPDKLLGRSVAGLWIEEASTVSQEVFEKLIPVCRFRGKMGRVALTFTPRGFSHWTFGAFHQEIAWDDAFKLPPGSYKVYRNKPYLFKDDTFLVTSSTRDNPFTHEKFYDRIANNYSSVLAAQELEGEFVEIEGEMFKRSDFKIVQSVPRDCQRVRYWDKASTAGDGCYSAGVLLAKDRNGIVYIESVIRGQWSALERNQIIKQTCEADRAKYGGEVITYIEQEGAGSGKDVNEALIRELGEFEVYSDPASVSARVKVGGVLLPGDAKVRRASLFAAQVQAHNVCVLEAPWMHDFLEECCLAKNSKIQTIQGSVNIQDIKPGEMVWTRKGWRRVLASEMTSPNATLYELKTTCGKSLLGTGTHPLWVGSKGFTRFDHVKENDDLLLLSTDFASQFGRIEKREQDPFTLPGLFTANVWTCIDTFTQKLMDAFQREATSTTSTAIALITELRTLLASVHQSTFESTCSKGMSLGQIERKLEFANVATRRSKHLLGLEVSFAHEHAQTSKILRTGSSISTKDFANYAARSLHLLIQRLDFALGSVVARGEASRSLDWLQEFVRIAKQNFSRETVSNCFVASRVEYVRRTHRVEPVYNLMVDGEPEYFANGILTHNCAFPHYTYCDQVDAASAGYLKIAKSVPFDCEPAVRLQPGQYENQYGRLTESFDPPPALPWG